MTIEKASENDYKKVNIIFPRKVLDELTRIAGKRKRGPFVVNLVKEELKRNRLMRVLAKTHGAWKKEDYPELKTEADTDLFVRSLREETEERYKRQSDG